MTDNNLRHRGLAVGFLLTYAFTALAQADDYFDKGHLKFQTRLIDDESPANGLDTRLNFSGRISNWVLQGDYQLVRSNSAIDDDRRLFDLTTTIHDNRQYPVIHRLDRFNIAYLSERLVFRAGRQAVSWGNGLIYNPMDFFNPFDPTSIDNEYKTGDDMLYGQYLLDNGNDVQAVWVGRRDSDGSQVNEVSSIAAKYHVFMENHEVDLLLAEHFDEQIIGIGGVTNIGGSVWRGDIISTTIDGQRHNSAVINTSYSWVACDKNMTGQLELFRNSFGIDNGDYSVTSLAQNTALIDRIGRGELFTLARHYLAGSVTIELTPLWLLTTTVFKNLDDESGLIQLTSRHDLQQNLQLLVAVNIPHGSGGTEFGGLESVTSTELEESLFAQIGYYF